MAFYSLIGLKAGVFDDEIVINVRSLGDLLHYPCGEVWDSV